MLINEISFGNIAHKKPNTNFSAAKITVFVASIPKLVPVVVKTSYKFLNPAIPDHSLPKIPSSIVKSLKASTIPVIGAYENSPIISSNAPGLVTVIRKEEPKSAK